MKHLLKKLLSPLLILVLLSGFYYSVQAISITNHMAAARVLGQPDFVTNSQPTILNGMSAFSIAVDPATKKVFVVDSDNCRVLRFASLSTLDNGATAEGVLGQPDFSSVTCTTSNTGLNEPYSAAIDTAGNLWVADAGNHRVLRFSSAVTLPDGAPADLVLGQPDFDTSSTDTSQNDMNRPYGVLVDSTGNLWVSDAYNNRVLFFADAVNLSNHALATGVLGAPDFTDGSVKTTDRYSLWVPSGLFMDITGTLWVADFANNRVMRYDNAVSLVNTGPLGGLTGPAANGVLGQPDFITYTPGISQSIMDNPWSLTGDSAGTLYVGDEDNNRVLVFNDAKNKVDGAQADFVVGQVDFDTELWGTSSQLFGTTDGVFYDESTDSLWVGDSYNNRVLMFADYAAAPVIDQPIDQAVLFTSRPTFSGMVEPNVEVNVWVKGSGSWEKICSNVSITTGWGWSCDPQNDLPYGDYELDVTATNLSGLVTHQVTFPTFTITSADLSSLILWDGMNSLALYPDFDPAVTSYDAYVPNNILSVNVNALSIDENAGVTVNGIVDQTIPINLLVGLNMIDVDVTATDGVTIKTYKINTYRATPPLVLAFISAPVTSAVQDKPYTYHIITGLQVQQPMVAEGVGKPIYKLTISAHTKPGWLTLTDNGDGTATLSGTPTASDVGANAVGLTVSDPRINVMQNFTINVDPAAPSQVLTFLSEPVTSAVQDLPYTYNILAGITDQLPLMTSQLIITADTKPSWLTLTDNGDGTATLSGTPTASDVGAYAVELTVSDGRVSVTQTFTVTVAANAAPEFSSQPATNLPRGEHYDYLIQSEDNDTGDAVTYSAVEKPAWLTLTDNTNGTATLSGDPGVNVYGSFNIIVRITDSKGASVDQTFTIEIPSQFKVFFTVITTP